MTIATDDTRWTFNIPECNIGAVRAKVAKLQRRAAKLGVPVPTVTEGEPADITLRDEMGRKFIQRYIPCAVTQDAPVKFGGWSFVGTIDHGTDDAGNSLNVIRSVPHFTGALPKSYRTDAPTCDHCRTIRRRNETFVVRHEDGELRRVGRQCIRDYLGGQEGKDILASATWMRTFQAAFEDSERNGYSFGGGIWRIGVLDALTWTAVAIRAIGWTSRTKAREDQDAGEATADTAWDAATLACGLRKPARDERLPELHAVDAQDAEAALAWARDIDPDTDSDYLHNLRVVLSRSSVSAKEMGLAASAVAVYQRERDRAIARKLQTALPSDWMGDVGQRFGGKGKTGIPTIQATILRRHSFEGTYGLTTVIVAQTAEGNDVINFNTGVVGDDIQVGKLVTITGTIKRHDTDSKTGRKQTSISRASFELTTSTPAPATAPVVEKAPPAAPHTEIQAAPASAEEASSAQGVVILLTAKRVDGTPFAATFADPAAAIQAAVDGRATGALNWRTCRYTINGVKTNTPALRRLARGN